MSKKRTSMTICKNYSQVYHFCANEIQHLLYGVEPKYYNCGIYGWNNDIYCFPERDLLIIMGYRNSRGKRCPYELAKEYDDWAMILTNGAKDWDEVVKFSKECREEFFDKLLTY